MKLKFFYQSGQSLIELMVGLAILTVALTAILSLTTKSVQLSEVAQLRDHAITTAKSRIETVKKVRDSQDSWVDFKQAIKENNDGDTIVETVDGVIRMNTELVSDVSFGWTTDISFRDSGSVSQVIADVFVTVDWEDAKGSHQVEDYTIISKLK